MSNPSDNWQCLSCWEVDIDMFRKFKQWKLDKWRKRQSNKVVFLPTTFNVAQVAEAAERMADIFSRNAVTTKQVLKKTYYL